MANISLFCKINEMKKLKLYFDLLFTFMKIGLFTFGGGYAMIPLIQNEVVEKKKWITAIEMVEIIAVAESTPGPVSVNAATYIGYKQAGIWGAILATLGLALPSFIIIYLLSLIYSDLLSLAIFQAMFKGIKVAVILLLFNAVIKLSKNIDKNYISIILFIITLITITTLSIFSISIPFISLAFILLGAVVGVLFTFLKVKKEGRS